MSKYITESIVSQAAEWITTLPTLKIQTTFCTKLSTVHWNALNSQTQLVVLSSGVGTTRTRLATQKLPTQEELQIESHLAQRRVDRQREQARISLPRFWNEDFGGPKVTFQDTLQLILIMSRANNYNNNICAVFWLKNGTVDNFRSFWF